MPSVCMERMLMLHGLTMIHTECIYDMTETNYEHNRSLNRKIRCLIFFHMKHLTITNVTEARDHVIHRVANITVSKLSWKWRNYFILCSVIFTTKTSLMFYLFPFELLLGISLTLSFIKNHFNPFSIIS